MGRSNRARSLRSGLSSTLPEAVEYGMLEFTTERRRIGSVAEFSCKYPDFRLPNECRTTWRDVYVEVPIPVMSRDHVDLDVPEWSWQDRQRDRRRASARVEGRNARGQLAGARRAAAPSP